MSRGLVPIRLCDVPQHVRAAAARREIRKDPDSAPELLYAVAVPSSRTYYLPATCEILVRELTMKEAA